MNITILKSIHFKALIVLVALFSSLSTMANNEDMGGVRVTFVIQNTNNYILDLEIHPSGCYNGTNPTPSEGIKKVRLQPNGTHRMTLHKGQASACDGKYGYVHLFFSYSPTGYNKNLNQMSTVHIGGGGDVHMDDRGLNSYPGYLTTKGSEWIFETYTTPTANWEVICTGSVCQNKTTVTNVSTESNSTQIDKATETALSASVTAGVEYGSFTGESTVTASHKNSFKTSMKSSISKSYSKVVVNPGLTFKQINDLGISGMYEFVAHVRHNGKDYAVRTGLITYMTEDDLGTFPRWLPGSAKDKTRNTISALMRANGK
jgi:hypothetical protein